MGIADLYTVLKEHCPEALVTRHLSELTGFRVAVDISIFFYKFVRSCGEKRWLNQFIDLLCLLKKHRIKAVCIFDGSEPPLEKQEEQERRRASSAKIVTKLEECQRLLDLVKRKYITPKSEKPLTPELQEEIRDLLKNRNVKVDTINYEDPYDVAEALRASVYKYQKQTLPITAEHKKQAIEIIEILGLGQMTSQGEAETLCAYLAVKGMVDAVLTEDTDVLAYGTPMFLAKLDMEQETVLSIIHVDMCIELGLELEEFRDLCILLSCDYNERVKGYPPDGKTHKKPVGIGTKGAWFMIEEYRRLEVVEEHLVDADPLNYRRCRILFTIPKKLDFDRVPFNRPIDKERLVEFVNEYKLRVNVNAILDNWKPQLIIEFENEVDSDTEEDNEEDDETTEMDSDAEDDPFEK